VYQLKKADLIVYQNHIAHHDISRDNKLEKYKKSPLKGRTG
jgi:hypothetical protein